jgi:hypothetical protein
MDFPSTPPNAGFCLDGGPIPACLSPPVRVRATRSRTPACACARYALTHACLCASYARFCRARVRACARPFPFPYPFPFPFPFQGKGK